MPPRVVLVWLERVFGFEIAMLIETPDGQVAHAGLRFGNALVMVGSEWHEDIASRKSLNR